MKPREMFLNDVDGHLVKLRQILRNPNPSFPEILRILHSFKGSAAALGFVGMTQYAHALEAITAKIKTGALAWNVESALFLSSAIDTLEAAMDVSRDSTSPSIDLKSHVGDALDFLKKSIESPVTTEQSVVTSASTLHSTTTSLNATVIPKFGLTVRVGKTQYLIPVESVQKIIYSPEILPISGSFLAAFESSGSIKNAKLVRFSNQLMPLLSPDALISDLTNAAQATVKPSIPWAVILWDFNGDAKLDTRFCLPVDEIGEIVALDSQQTQNTTLITISVGQIRNAASHLVA